MEAEIESEAKQVRGFGAALIVLLAGLRQEAVLVDLIGVHDREFQSVLLRVYFCLHIYLPVYTYVSVEQAALPS